jgi:predicted phosphate transport protein (TIGR00153 family)
MIDGILKTFTQIKGRFSAKPNRFLDRLRQQARMGVEAADALVSYMDKPNKKNANHIRELETNADEVRRILVDELNRTFVTPIDREDIHMLSRVIDDIADYIWATVNEMDILEVEPNSYLRQMAEMMRESAEEIKLAMERIPQHPGVATTHAIRARAIDNRMETLYAEALAELFRKPKDLESLVSMMKLREIYRHLFHASQRVADAANIIEDIVVKFF